MLPAACANGAPIFSSHIPKLAEWNARMDFGKRFHGRPLLGSHKTWRGMLSGIVLATLILWIQQVLATHFIWANMLTDRLNYATIPVFIVGPLFGIGALGGDALKSFFKRRHGTKSGESWLPFDQLDYIIGAVLISLPFAVLTVRQYILIFVMWFVLHIAGTVTGWKLGLKDKPI
jgi:CDP-2,3-bis-(O-geranylgeranyl)-sn-glycerol synthase